MKRLQYIHTARLRAEHAKLTQALANPRRHKRLETERRNRLLQIERRLAHLERLFDQSRGLARLALEVVFVGDQVVIGTANGEMTLYVRESLFDGAHYKLIVDCEFEGEHRRRTLIGSDDLISPDLGRITVGCPAIFRDGSDEWHSPAIRTIQHHLKIGVG